jgi:uncharacterized protein (DUF1800 family)
MRRQGVMRLTVALPAAVLAAACTFDRSGPHPLRTRRVQIAHLLRRAGFGYNEQTLDEYDSLGVAHAVKRLLDYDSVADDVDERLKMLGGDLRKLPDLQRWWLFRMAFTKRPLQEKMTLFWHGLLTSATSKVGLPNPTPQNPNPPHYMLDQNQFFRAHALDHFSDILLGIARTPAMMIWLDSQTNVKGKPNENFARELMELFSLGIAGPDGRPTYTEQDVREAARAFTGWGLQQGRFAFNAGNHDTGPKTVLGTTANMDGNDVVKLVASQPAAAHYLSRRLWEFFAYPNPSEHDLAPLAQAYVRTAGSVKEMLRALFTSPAFYSAKAYRALVKSPAEYVVGVVRMFGAGSVLSELPLATTRMGQALFNPPNVAGWPGGIDWINSSSWLARVNFANAVLTARDNASQLSEAIERHRLASSAALVDHFGGLLLDRQLSADTRRALLNYLTDGKASIPVNQRTGSLSPDFVDRKVRGLLYLLVASPEYQLA